MNLHRRQVLVLSVKNGDYFFETQVVMLSYIEAMTESASLLLLSSLTGSVQGSTESVASSLSSLVILMMTIWMYPIVHYPRMNSHSKAIYINL